MTALVGVTEAANILGWSRGRVSTYAQRGLLPKPIDNLACGTVWHRHDIVLFAAEQVIGLTVKEIPEHIGSLRLTFGIGDDEPIGGTLAVQGLLTNEQGVALDVALRTK